MSKISLLCLSLLCFFVSCKKDKDDNGYHISCKINGVPASFNTAIVARNLTQGDAVGFAIEGATKTDGDAESFAINIMDPSQQKSVGRGSYNDMSTEFDLVATYRNEIAWAYAAGTAIYKAAVAHNKTIIHHFTFTLTEIDENTARGTFSGDFFPGGDLNGETKTITEGYFYVPLAK